MYYTYITLHIYIYNLAYKHTVRNREGTHLLHGQEPAAAAAATKILALVRLSTIEIRDLNYFDPVLGLRAQRGG